MATTGLIVLALLLPGCSSDAPGASAQPALPAADAPEASTSSQAAPPTQPVPTAGSVLRPATKRVNYSDGLSISFISAVDLRDNELGFEVPAANTLVRITVEVANQTGAALPLYSNLMRVQYGSERYDAKVEGYAGDTRTLMDPFPNQVADHHILTIYQTFSVPKSQLATLVVTPTIAPEVHPSYTFTDVGKSIKQ